MLSLNRERVAQPRFHRRAGDNSFQCKDGWIYVLAIGQPRSCAGPR